MDIKTLMHDFNIVEQKTDSEISVINSQIDKYPDLFKDASDKFKEDVAKATAQDTGQSEIFSIISKEYEKRRKAQTQHSHIVNANKDFKKPSLVDEEVYYSIVSGSYSNRGMATSEYYTNDSTIDKGLVEDNDVMGIVHESSTRYSNMFGIDTSDNTSDNENIDDVESSNDDSK